MCSETQERRILVDYMDIVKITENLPTGAKDPNAMTKFCRIIDLPLDDIMAHVDCVFLLVKATHTGLISWEVFLAFLRLIEKDTRIQVDTLLTMCFEKYKLRAQYGKNDEVERRVIAGIMGYIVN